MTGRARGCGCRAARRVRSRGGARCGPGAPRRGYDDALSRPACFDLTTVSLNAEEQARQAVTAAVERLDHGRAAQREIVLAPSLIERGSTAEVR
ncbi:substrate-binding domain-containing protein [Streptomyces sp. NPDC057199]|uniref:substrate-binding domain-containing protein n=1 Tax=Streptomyces sp. NPDC057199 TaxID=3346047 RepID=UPI00363E23BF